MSYWLAWRQCLRTAMRGKRQLDETFQTRSHIRPRTHWIPCMHVNKWHVCLGSQPNANYQYALSYHSAPLCLVGALGPYGPGPCGPYGRKIRATPSYVFPFDNTNEKMQYIHIFFFFVWGGARMNTRIVSRRSIRHAALSLK